MQLGAPYLILSNKSYSHLSLQIFQHSSRVSQGIPLIEESIIRLGTFIIKITVITITIATPIHNLLSLRFIIRNILQ